MGVVVLAKAKGFLPVKAKNSLLDKPSKEVPDTDERVFSPF